MIRGQELEKLEILAKQFIIDFKPMSDRQTEIWDNIQSMQIELQRIDSKRRRVKTIINMLYKALAQD